MKTDTDLQQQVLDELVWEPSIDAAAIGVAVEDGVVTLTGHVPSFAEKWTAEFVAKGVAGTRAVANDILVRLPGASARTDSDIARAALNALEWDVWVPQQRITVTVSDGWVKLDGTVDTQHQKLAAERAVPEDPSIVFQAGTHTDTMRIRYADFARLAKPTVLDIARASGVVAGYY